MEHINELIGRHLGKSLLIDSNLLILYIVGRIDPSLVGSKPTGSYEKEDFDLLSRFVGKFAKLVTTPNVLTEVSNLGGKLPEGNHGRFRSLLAREIEVMDETYCESAKAGKDPHFQVLGLTDSAIATAMAGRCLVLTDDLPLYQILMSRGFDAVNFNHIRAAFW
jgi:hypothetical protein